MSRKLRMNKNSLNYEINKKRYFLDKVINHNIIKNEKSPYSFIIINSHLRRPIIGLSSLSYSWV
jgi:hypothetical protein